MVLKQLIIVIFSCALLPSCATTTTDSRPDRDLDGRGTDCISIRTIRDYTSLDNRSLIVEGGGKRKYFVQLISPSMELRSAIQVGFQSRDDWLCPYGGDQIVFDSPFREAVGIRSINRISADQHEDLLIRYGLKEPPEQNDPPPPELDGADVEELGEVG